MKPQDIVILVILHLKDKNWTYQELSTELQMSTSTIFASLERCQKVGLYSKKYREVYISPFLEMLFYGLKYIFPAEPGRIVKGIPTAHSAAPLSHDIVAEKDVYVWKCAEGRVRGQEIFPLYKTVPKIAQVHPQFYEIMSLIDALRVGKARERNLAKEYLTQKFMNHEQ